MTGIIIAGHGHFSGGMASAIELVAGVPQYLEIVEFCKGQDVGELKRNMTQAIETLDTKDILLMVDILGGSPFQVGTQLLTEQTEKNMKIIAGANMAAVIHAVFSREMVPFEELASQVLAAGKEGLVDVSALIAGMGQEL